MELSSSHTVRSEVLVSHVNARLTVHGRRLIVDRVAAGRPVAHIAAELGVSRQTAYRWVRRFRAEGPAGLPDRSSRPRSSPARTSSEREQAVLDARRSVRFGPLRIAALTGVCRSGQAVPSRVRGKNPNRQRCCVDHIASMVVRGATASWHPT